MCDLPNLGLVFLIDALARWIWNKVELVHANANDYAYERERTPVEFFPGVVAGGVVAGGGWWWLVVAGAV